MLGNTKWELLKVHSPFKTLKNYEAVWSKRMLNKQEIRVVSEQEE